MSIKIYNRKDGRKKPFGAKWTKDGKRKFQFFETEKERDKFIKKFSETVTKNGSAIMQISSIDAAIMLECIKKLGNSTNVLRAVDNYSNSTASITKDISEAETEYISEKINSGFDDDYIRQIKHIIPLFTKDYPGLCCAATTADAIAWTNALPLAPGTVASHIKRMRAFFNWMIKHGYTKENIFNLVQIPKIRDKEPGFLTIEQTQSLMSTAQHDYPDAVAYFALGAFAGLRSSATVGLDPASHIRFDQKGILITAANAKNARRQFIDGHEPNLWDWLNWSKKHAPEGFALSKRLWEHRREQVSKKAGVKMPHNALRHSFCTYHCALHGDAGKTATLLTHRGNVAILYQHYKGNASRTDAQAYFSIVPV
jgi:site-specific recombinase XerD